MNLLTYNSISKLIKEFSLKVDQTSTDFIEEKLVQITEDEVKYFLYYEKHKPFLYLVKDDFVEANNLKRFKEHAINIVLYIIIFVLEEDNFEDILHILLNAKSAFTGKILTYLSEEPNIITITVYACKVFDNEYVLQNIIQPLLNKLDSISKMQNALQEEKLKKIVKKPLTVPVSPKIQCQKRIPPVPLNTPIEISKFIAKDIPESTYKPCNIEQKLTEDFKKNRQKAIELLLRARALSVKYKRKQQEIIEEEFKKFKALKAPKVKNVEIKSNLTTTLREANLCMKEEETKCGQIEEILKGGYNMENFKRIEREMREIEERKKLEDIERKHLQGLLTFEESILAKQKLVQLNKENARKCIEEREKFAEILQQWKEAEDVKIKLLVKQCHAIEQAAKESGKKLLKQRQNQAFTLKQETIELLHESCKEKEMELQQKINLIQEIKALHQLKMSLQTKDFNPNESPNFGLLCEMTLIELQDNLVEIKKKVKQDVERKRQYIVSYRKNRSDMIEEIKNFVSQARQRRMSKPSKSKTVPICPRKLEQNNDLSALRNRLENAKSLRKNSDG